MNSALPYAGVKDEYRVYLLLLDQHLRGTLRVGEESGKSFIHICENSFPARHTRNMLETLGCIRGGVLPGGRGAFSRRVFSQCYKVV